jgi:hypothetical protein
MNENCSKLYFLHPPFFGIFLSLELFFLSYFHSKLIEIEGKTADAWGLLVGVGVVRRCAAIG